MSLWRARPIGAGDPDECFRTDHLRADLTGRSVRGGAVTLTSQGAKFVLSLGSTMLLARLLTPQDFGLIAMVTAVTGFVSLFKDLGLANATVQRAEINHRQVSTLFWVNMGVSGLIMVVTFALAPLVAWFYHEPRLTPITMALAVGFLFGGLTVQHQALLRRQMRFVSLAVVEIVSLAVGIATGVGLALGGVGCWALVYMQLAMGAANAVAVWVACRWRPGPPVRHSGIGSMLVFGGHLTGFEVVNYFARNLDNVLIGKYWGPQALGFYAKAYQLLLWPIQQINGPATAVAIPSLSRLQNDPEQLRRYYLNALSLVATVTLPVALFFMSFAGETVAVVLGPQWREAAVIFRLLAISALVQPILNVASWLLVATGRTGRILKWGLAASPIIVISFFVGLPHGARGVAVCYSVVILLLAWPCILNATLGTVVRPLDVVHAVKKQFAASVLAALPCLALKYGWGEQLAPGWLVLIGGGLMAGVYGAVMIGVFKMKDFYWSLWRHFQPHRPGSST